MSRRAQIMADSGKVVTGESEVMVDLGSVYLQCFQC